MPNGDSFSFLPLGHSRSALSDLHPALEPHAQALYEQAWDAYRTAGCPYGMADEAMLVWFALSPADGHRPLTGRN